MAVEQILLNKKRNGTKAVFFSNNIDPLLFGSDELKNGYLISDGLGNPIQIVESVDETIYKRNADNNFQLINGTHYIISGKTFTREFDYQLSSFYKNDIYNDLIRRTSASTVLNLSVSSNTTINFINNVVSYVFFIDTLLDDMFVTVNMQRTIDTLDTLLTYNKVQGELPVQESKTGVVMGRLTAIQKVFDENGKRIVIPLKNTPVIIFKPSDTFPNETQLDDNGDRIRLNLSRGVLRQYYFNDQSYKTDIPFLKDVNEFENIPPHYYLSCITNENGEFIIQDVPVGNQTLMFEVDLLKQGLTHDEVTLNFGPYPADEFPNVDSIPHYYFRSLQLNVLPSWGTFQTGYTEINVKVNLDLRKWATYYIPPVVYGNKTLDEQVFNFDNTPISVSVRDMTSTDFELKKVEIGEIHDLTKKEEDQVTEWQNETKQLKKRAEFYGTEYKAFKLPANLFDPNGIGTDNKVGVWLCAYQFKMFYKDESAIYRATGYKRQWTLNSQGAMVPVNKSNYDLTYNASDTNLSPQPGIGTFPYEKPWTINYPSPYKIPKLPTQLNTNKGYYYIGYTDEYFPNKLVEPKYLDGDRVDNPTFDYYSTGYGLQINGDSYEENIFTRRITFDSLFKYESGVWWNEEYSNGYKPTLDSAHVSSVIDGEKWQRLEAGYGYWLKPEGWPRIVNLGSQNDFLLPTDIYGQGAKFISNGISFGNVFSTMNNPHPGFTNEASGMFLPYNNISVDPFLYFGNTKKIQRNNMLSLSLDANTKYHAGGLDIYRIKSPENVLPPEYLARDSYADLNFQRIMKMSSYPRQNPTHTYDGTNSVDIDDDNSRGGGKEGMAYDGGSFYNLSNRFGWGALCTDVWSPPGGFIDIDEDTYPTFSITNDGSKDVEILGTTIGVGQTQSFDIRSYYFESGGYSWLPSDFTIRFPGNFHLDAKLNMYTQLKYTITIGNIEVPVSDISDANQWTPRTYSQKIRTTQNGILGDTHLGAGSSDNIPTYYLVCEVQYVMVPIPVRNAYNPSATGYGGMLMKRAKVDGILFGRIVFADGLSVEYPYLWYDFQTDTEYSVLPGGFQNGNNEYDNNDRIDTHRTRTLIKAYFQDTKIKGGNSWVPTASHFGGNPMQLDKNVIHFYDQIYPTFPYEQ